MFSQRNLDRSLFIIYINYILVQLMFVEPARWTIRKRWSPNQWNAGHAKKAVVQTNILYDTWAFKSFMTEQLRSYVFMHLHENALMIAWMRRSWCYNLMLEMKRSLCVSHPDSDTLRVIQWDSVGMGFQWSKLR